MNIFIFYFVESHSTIDLPNVDANSLESLVNVAYMGRISTSQHTAEELQRTSEFLGIDSLTTAFSDTASDPCSNITDSSQSSKILANLNKQRQEDKYVDLVIIVGDHRIAVHKCVLLAFSQYFNGLLNPQMKEGECFFHLGHLGHILTTY